jgi:multiple sugar transport system ATP-binding protein
MGFLDIDNVTKSYGAVEVLHQVDIAVEEGEFLVLVGPSGCGKSTLLNMIAGLEGITSGEIKIKDRVVNGVHPSKRNIAMVFQSYALYPNMTVGQNITFGLEMHGVAKPERDKADARGRQLLQIENLLDRKPGQLSGGQRQRVAMGRALVRNPDVFLFDEPLSNLDAKLRVDMRTEIKKLHQKLGTTIVYVTHDQIEAMTLSTRIAVMYDGYVQQLGTPKEIYDTPSNLFVATFMGSPAMNVLPARLVEQNGALSAVIAGADGEERAPEDRERARGLRGLSRQARHPRCPSRGDHRPRRRRPQCPERAATVEPRQRDRARGLGHLRHHDRVRQGLHRADAGGCGCASGAEFRFRSEHGQGRPVRSRNRETDR